MGGEVWPRSEDEMCAIADRSPKPEFQGLLKNAIDVYK